AMLQFADQTHEFDVGDSIGKVSLQVIYLRRHRVFGSSELGGRRGRRLLGLRAQRDQFTREFQPLLALLILPKRLERVLAHGVLGLLQFQSGQRDKFMSAVSWLSTGRLIAKLGKTPNGFPFGPLTTRPWVVKTVPRSSLKWK